MTRKKTDEGVHLPNYVPEDGYPEGDGPLWIAKAIGVEPGTVVAAAAYLSSEDESTAIVLMVGDFEFTFRPARLIVTRRLIDILSGKGFPVPNYAPPQLLLLGQAIARLAHEAQNQEEERAADELASLVAGWACDCLRENVSYILRGREGVDVRAAISHVRNGYVKESLTVPLIAEPARGVLLAWSAPLRSMVRSRLGTMHDGDIGLQLQRGGLARHRLAARPDVAGGKTVEMPVWVLYNGWQNVNVEMPDEHGDCGPLTLLPVVERSGTSTHAPVDGHAHDR